jgi:hypothetical protein
MARDDTGSSFVAGFLVGGIVGAIVGILLAPKSGAETRAELLAQSETWRERAEEMAANVRERVGPTVEGVRERVQPVVEKATSMRRGVATPDTDGGPASEVGHGDDGEEKRADA